MSKSSPVILHTLLPSDIFFDLPNIFMHAPDGWLAEPHNSPFSVFHD
jgi:hypothetical protein